MGAWYNGGMNDKDNDNMVRCDACGLLFPAHHMADNWLVSDLCVPCDAIIAKDLDEIPCTYDPCGV